MTMETWLRCASTIGKWSSWSSDAKERCVCGRSRSHPLRVPKVFNLRTYLFERADITSNTYYNWFIHHDFIALAANAIVVPFLETFKQFPPRHQAASFTIDQAMEKMEAALTGAGH